MKTFRFRIKNPNAAILNRMAGSVDFVWNYCNSTAVEYLDKQSIWISEFDLNNLTRGCSRDLSIHSKTIQLISGRYFSSRLQTRKRKLSWRSSRRSLGWIPFNNQCISIHNDSITYNKQTFRFWKSREIIGRVKSGSFSRDSKGYWYVSFVCEAEETSFMKSVSEVGIDLGLKTIATLSSGCKLHRENFTNKYAPKLAMAQRAKKKKRVTAIHTKIKNSRKDWNHKETTKLVNQYDKIFVGNVSPSELKKTNMAKSVSDASWSAFKSMLAYKAIALGVEYKEVKENFSTVTCSVCFERTGPSGLSALGVREWTCKCGASHDRDVNAAKNILRFGHETPIKGSLKAAA